MPVITNCGTGRATINLSDDPNSYLLSSRNAIEQKVVRGGVHKMHGQTSGRQACDMTKLSVRRSQTGRFAEVLT